MYDFGRTPLPIPKKKRGQRSNEKQDTLLNSMYQHDVFINNVAEQPLMWHKNQIHARH